MYCQLEFDYEDPEAKLGLSEEEVKEVICATLEYEAITAPVSLSLLICSDATIQQLNAQWRGVDRPTDVLSFPMDLADGLEVAADELARASEELPCELGDIVLSPSYIKAQAAAFGSTYADETRLMLIHSCLHLLGYDHAEDEETAEMRSHEEAILATIAHDKSLSDVVLARHREEPK